MKLFNRSDFYNNYHVLNEGRSVKINEIEMIKLIKENCQVWLNNLNLSRIFRGVNNEDKYLFIDPNEYERKSLYQDDKSFYHWIITSSNKWKSFPLRSKSIICINKLSIAKDYGGSEGTYEVIPYDNAKFGICPTKDLWESFDLKFATTLDEFNYTLNLFTVFCKKYKIEIPSVNSTESVKDWCTVIDDNNDQLSEHLSKLEENDREVYILRKLLVLFKKYGTYDYLENLLDPVNNEFKILKYDDTFNLGKETHEVWTDSPCILIKYPFNDNIRNEIKLREIKNEVI